ncbi:hypothetical protein AVEN_270877-1 [Araneus ventricosus]|uniref:Uncharacterized protein n=1 Tax=Araneus ventricosus TaxID=182803 RepID=A0A4Y2LXC7_ARAVE|nr:hypothetical protein AVEN_270877-1 [Araneus ventricosus]
MIAAAITSSTEDGVLVVHHRATARPHPKEVRSITGGGIQALPLLYPQGKRLPAYLSGSKSYTCTRGSPWELQFIWFRGTIDVPHMPPAAL